MLLLGSAGLDRLHARIAIPDDIHLLRTRSYPRKMSAWRLGVWQ